MYNALLQKMFWNKLENKFLEDKMFILSLLGLVT